MNQARINTERVDLNRIIQIFKVECFLIVVTLILEWVLGFMGPLKVALGFIFIFLYYQFTTRAIKMLYYTYWTLTLLMSIYLIYKMVTIILTFDYVLYAELGLIYLSILFLTAIKSYILFSPIFYPRVYWWEYDFRYREDWNINIKRRFKVGQHFNGRLMDLRRGAGCVISFAEFDIGEIIDISIANLSVLKLENKELQGEIVSKREYLFGRGFTYGIKFILDTKLDRLSYRQFSHTWKKRRKEKIKMKFAKNRELDGDLEGDKRSRAAIISE